MYLLNFIDEASAVDEINDIVIAGGAEMFLGEVGIDAVPAEYLGAVGTELGLLQFFTTKRTY